MLYPNPLDNGIQVKKRTKNSCHEFPPNLLAYAQVLLARAQAQAQAGLLAYAQVLLALARAQA